ncbi:DUF5134 domain-containing protein [Amycolatopsis rhabdoformis]|uniref:DUF5134 domain-containing protein n=1 Tax=Amycolatopsis rhabdoformis TaxID=1448059 RepID=A0ABZ1IDI3_9PSEU|nr:DUF5134 domain-containing protein [Amycolatopsis rhabdoformis]WSE32136.1 DUF5134 domain-containing protein [Amycolatopsis rhabdoformis]
MFSSPALSWLFTVVFALTGLYSLYRFAGLVSGTGRAGDRAAELTHLLMSVAMIGMTWAWTGLPDAPSGVLQLAVFGLLALWFAGRLLAGGHGIFGGYHLLMALAMVWMVATMPLLMGGMPGMAAGGGMADMPDMPGMSTSGAAPVSSGPVVTPGWVRLTTVVLVVLSAAAAAGWLARGLRRRAPSAADHHSHRYDAACHTLMSLGMGGMLLAML